MKKYSNEFKREAVELADSSDCSVNETEQNLGVYQGAIRQWRRELKNDPGNAFPGTGHLKPEDEELRRLKRENANLRMERDILKKAMAIFSKDPNRYLDS
jgi:transposase